LLKPTYDLVYAERKCFMPRKPKRPCSYPGCPELTDGRYCEKHQRITNQQYEQYGRDKISKKRYGREWQRIRAAFVAAHPLCELCLKQGKVTPTEEVHHILPLRQGGTNDSKNLMALCKACHPSITMKDNNKQWNAK